MPSPLGAPPTYSTSATLGLALLAVVAALWHFTLGALDYVGSGRYPGLALLLLSGLLLVYGVLILIRYAEARDAMGDPQPRSAMYETPHEGRVPLVGLGLAGLLVLGDLAFALSGELPLWHAGGLLLALLLGRQAWRLRPVGEDN
ncbi:hypothetical protein RDMS_12440 [Deinococcus sp. RL]|uniref:hypothetical protein n=1 Tax=Deinococcus sp. RL TaxID=1489678 RepID=UPI0004D6DDCF|nr:hypothetical protein [Deinococcus sp. RL]KEF33323.1 hypothetical protein RDMS_12440 [Deinococcus sp. RL]